MGILHRMTSRNHLLICGIALVFCAALVASAEPEDFVPNELYANPPNNPGPEETLIQDKKLTGRVVAFKGGRAKKWCADEGGRIICNRPWVRGWENLRFSKLEEAASLSWV